MDQTPQVHYSFVHTTCEGIPYVIYGFNILEKKHHLCYYKLKKLHSLNLAISNKVKKNNKLKLRGI